MGIAFVIGHTPYSKGAFSKYFNSSEWDFYNKYFTKINAVGNVFVHDNDLGYTSRQKEMAKKTRDFDIVFELHFNASNWTAHGCEALHYHLNDTAKKISEVFCEDYTKQTGAKNRGAKKLSNSGDRGYGFVSCQKPTAIILEPFFGDSANLVKIYLSIGNYYITQKDSVNALSYLDKAMKMTKKRSYHYKRVYQFKAVLRWFSCRSASG